MVGKNCEFRPKDHMLKRLAKRGIYIFEIEELIRKAGWRSAKTRDGRDCKKVIGQWLEVLFDPKPCRNYGITAYARK